LSHDTRTVWSQQSWLLTTYARLAAVDVVCFVAMGAGIGNDTLSREEVVVFDRREWLQRRRGHAALPRAVLPQHVDGGADVGDAHGPLELRARLIISTMGTTGVPKAKANMSPRMDLMVTILQRISTMNSNHSKEAEEEKKINRRNHGWWW
jgi:hypothetical protein